LTDSKIAINSFFVTQSATEKTWRNTEYYFMDRRLGKEFFLKDVLEVAPALLGKTLVRVFPDGRTERLIITETEAYRGEEDRACHASKGRTARTKVMYGPGGHVYVYLVYGMYWMLNFVTGKTNVPQAVLIRGVKSISGPGKLTRYLAIDKSFYGEDLSKSDRLYVIAGTEEVTYKTTPRIGIDYAGEIWKNKSWRFVLEE
jgi:DNA-3-methyladenine glycosylase